MYGALIFFVLAAQFVHTQAAIPVQIAYVGDSTTEGYGRGVIDWPTRLQTLLDFRYGKDTYIVTNLGKAGKTMLPNPPNAYSAYVDHENYQRLLDGTWDIVTIMFGTNDAKDWPG